MIKSLIFILIIGLTAFSYTDLAANSMLNSLILPIVILLSLFALGFWFVALFHKYGINQTSNSNGTDSSGVGGFDSGDC